MQQPPSDLLERARWRLLTSNVFLNWSWGLGEKREKRERLPESEGERGLVQYYLMLNWDVRIIWSRITIIMTVLKININFGVVTIITTSVYWLGFVDFKKRPLLMWKRYYYDECYRDNYDCYYHEKPTKILTTQSWSLSFTDTYVPKLPTLAKLWVL